ncbi:chromosomal protein D1-like isoform X2 [Myxocyprinus asiaticus]|uniref:chromosomal protein D1-like isoform X2 n=1 Tax=Myxocyprinus asiaticus TaxID=70543 RepID=UPI002222B723|nr:chromosomal protein D1-like isoform X2 [Myxocyprinus asiaticus]
MEVENTDGSENTVSNGSTHPPKRGRGRPRGSLNKKFTYEKVATQNARPSRKVEFFSPEIIIRKVKKRGRPKKIKMRGRPRKIPLTPEEVSEKLHRLSTQRKRKLWKPLGRPRIHPIKEGPKIKRARGRPRKNKTMTESSKNDTHQPSVEISLAAADGPPPKRGRPLGSLKKKRGRPAGSTKTSPTKVSDWTPRKRGRPPGSANKVKIVKQVDGTPKKRGRPPGSQNKVKIMKHDDGTPKKRGRPPGSGKKVTANRVGEGARKRGRPPGSGKTKVHVSDSADCDQGSYAATNASGQHRKRGRPRKAMLNVVTEKLPSAITEEDEMENDEPSPKQSRNSDSSSQIPNETAGEENGASENNEDPEYEEDEEDDNSDSPKVNSISEKEMGEAASFRVQSDGSCTVMTGNSLPRAFRRWPAVD